ncbi:MAG: hydroxymethylbilane synthase [Sedimentisphaerales bacterium]|nr:hydroxymethylbilane synthase [Sedimentisphaerales bacterium]
MTKFRIATRSSSLALIQTQIVIKALRKVHPGIDFEIVEIKSKGDIDRNKPLWKLSETGFFTAAIEETLRSNKADIAVHSYKDLPIAEPKDIITAAVLDRRFCQDCLVAAQKIESLKDLPKGAKVGTSSLRRRAQILKLRPDIICEPIRGNVPTRVEKVNSGQYDASVLAYAGLERLGLTDKISVIFDPTEFIPAPAQGAIAVQTRAADTDTINLLSAIDDEQSRISSDTERLIWHHIKAGCHAPAGVFAKIEENDIIIYAFVSDGQTDGFINCRLQGPVAEAKKIARDLADQLLAAGASELLNNG